MVTPVYICEDRRELAEQYKALIQKNILIEEYPMEIIGTFTNPYTLISAAKNQVEAGNVRGIYFLDIDLNSHINGFTLSKLIRKFDSRAFIIFITTHANLALMSFRLHVEAMDFIVKDNIPDFNERIIGCLKQASLRVLDKTDAPTLTIRSGGESYIYKQADIIYFTTSETPHHINVITTKLTNTLRTSLRDLQNVLTDGFMLCHRSALINTAHIKSVDFGNKTVTMSNDDTLPVSASGAKSLSAYINSINIKK
ncbi:MAG: LytTR family DNA-binding domain-containing protein [Clostridium sp.]|nr:LytTR family DNA-binding domain-containing protein [Clostridium sp.]MCM1398554.1 LytTR family DNA-binding domain-containing protein [Clostridium sp.]MCM1459842.1 LytTR family DNA-binding domain-containing protein [Bacteroides sp.]